MNAPAYNFAYLNEQTKRMIRRAILKAVAIPGYQVPFAAREMPMPLGWGTGGVQVTAAILTPEDTLKVIDQGADDTTNAVSIRKFFVKKDERALLFAKGDFVEVLGPGEHFRFDPLRRLTVEKFALANGYPTYGLTAADASIDEDCALHVVVPFPEKGDSWGEPSRRWVDSTALWLSRTKSRASSRSTAHTPFAR